MIYPASLAVLSVLVTAAERLWPWRRHQKQLRPWLWSDLVYLLFNGHFLGLILFGVAVNRVLPTFDAVLMDAGVYDSVMRGVATDWPLWAQAVVALVAVDFTQWCVHNALHRIGPLWNLHKVHHSVKDGEMDWVVSFRFQWTEVVLYKAVLYLPLAWFGFASEALMFHAVFGTLIGHLNHANLNIDWGWGKYVLNSPRMHIWHHDYDAKPPAYNFGIIFSTWDWIFGTAHLPDHPPRKLGYEGVEELPQDFFRQTVWQVGQLVPAIGRSKAALGGIGLAMLATGWIMHNPSAVRTPMLGETAAASQPTAGARTTVDYADTPEQADAALLRFGDEASRAGYAHPEWMVSAREVAEALGSSRLVMLDVRPTDRVEAGRVPSALPVARSDYSQSAPAPGVSADAATLQAMLRARGVDADDVVVLTGDGGPEPYRLWWTLRTVGGVEARVLDGGLPAWKALGEAVAGGPPLDATPGTVTLSPPASNDALMWTDLAALQSERPGLMLVDTRSADEFTGTQQHKKAARAGHIPGAYHLDWAAVHRDGEADPRLLPPAPLADLLQPFDNPVGVVTYCQSGTRSAGLYFAMLQVGWPTDRLWNYDGSWAEYSRMADLAVQTGPAPAATP